MIESNAFWRTMKSGAALMAGATALSLASCSNYDLDSGYDARHATIAAGEIPAGTNVRNSPGVDIDNYEGDRNRCGTLDEPLILEEQSGYEALSLDPDGPWIGLEVQNNPDVPSGCHGDNDGIFWVSDRVANLEVHVDETIDPIRILND